MTATHTTPRICGVDISLTATGIADNAGRCEKVGRDGVLKLPLHARAAAIANLAEQVCAAIGVGTTPPALVVLEGCAAAQAYGGAAERAGLWWTVVHWLREQDIPVVEVPPSLLKKYALGKGAGKKGEVIEAVTRRWPMFSTGGDDNLCDAIVLACMGADHAGVPVATVPALHREALAKVAWPEAVTG
ncbi:hypothetical protein [Streptosporangium sp. V21-05]|uniref:hypothetical protein n=1 Tax=Streptosporangium sp. V21-05 TaxID=3446115 RepID=UPI003F531355